MDWARAKKILIVLLVMLNLTLTAAIISRAIGGGADRAFYSNVTRVLGDRGVTMRCDFPKQITSSEQLVYGDGARFVESCAKALISVDRRAAWVEMPGRESLRYINLRPDENLNTASVSALDADIRRVLGEWGVDMAGFTTDYTAKTANGEHYYQFILDYKGKLVFDSNINVYVNGDGGIAEIAISYREIKGVTIDKLMSVIPAYQVLLKNYYEEGAVVESISIGFMGQNMARENPFKESEECAVWRVRLEDGSERFFEAAYGDEIARYSHL